MSVNTLKGIDCKASSYNDLVTYSIIICTNFVTTIKIQILEEYNCE
jgi:hypothetical protein